MSVYTIGYHHRKANIFINKYQELITCLPVEESLMNAFLCIGSLNTLSNQSQALNWEISDPYFQECKKKT